MAEVLLKTVSGYTNMKHFYLKSSVRTESSASFSPFFGRLESIVAKADLCCPGAGNVACDLETPDERVDLVLLKKSRYNSENQPPFTKMESVIDCLRSASNGGEA